MTLYSGRQGYAAISVQTSPTTPVQPDVFIPYTSLSWDSAPDRSYETEHRANTDKNHAPITSSVTTEGSITFPAYPAGGLEHAFYGVFGSYTATTYNSTPAYGYSFTQGPTLPIFTLANGLSDLNYREYSDVMFKSLKLSAQPKEKLEVTVDGFSYMMNISNTKLTPSYTTNNALNFSDLTISYGGSSVCNILSVELEIDRGTESYYTACEGLNYGLAHSPYFAVTGTFEAFFEDWSYVQDWMGDTNTFDDSPTSKEMVLTFTGDLLPGTTDKYTNLVITLPKVYLDAVPLPFEGDEAIKMSISFTAVYDASTTKTASAVITSNLADIS